MWRKLPDFRADKKAQKPKPVAPLAVMAFCSVFSVLTNRFILAALTDKPKPVEQAHIIREPFVSSFVACRDPLDLFVCGATKVIASVIALGKYRRARAP